MRNFIIFLAILFMIPCVAGAEITAQDLGDFNDLSPQDKAAVVALIAQKNTTSSSVPTVEQVKPWVDMFDGLGDGLVKFAKDMGMTANELLNTPVGFITIAMIAYKVFGTLVDDLIQTVLWVSVMTPIVLLFLFKITIPVVEYRTVTRLSFFGIAGKPVEVNRPIRAKFGFEEYGDSPNCGRSIMFVLLMVIYLAGLGFCIG